MIVKWFAGVVHIRRVIKRDGPMLTIGCQIGDGPFEPCIKLTFVMKLRIFYTLNGRDGTTDVECIGPDTEAARTKLKKAFPGIVIHKVKAIRS